MYESKPGAADGARDRGTHYDNCYDRQTKEIRTIQKKVFGSENLSKVGVFVFSCWKD